MAGKVLYVDNWTGQEIDADESDTEACGRLGGAWRKFRDLASTSKVRTGVGFSAGTEGIGISPGRWATDDAYQMFNDGRTRQAWGYSLSGSTEDWVFVSREDMERALTPDTGEPVPEPSHWLLWSTSLPTLSTTGAVADAESDAENVGEPHSKKAKLAGGEAQTQVGLIPATPNMGTQRKRRGGKKPGLYRSRLRKFLEWLNGPEQDGLLGMTLKDICDQARKRLEKDNVKGVPRTRQGLEKAVKAEMDKILKGTNSQPT